jgi:hypothetical protein
MAKRTKTTRAARRPVQKPGGPPVIEDPKLPRMGEGASPVDGRRPRAVMPDDPPEDEGARRRMGAVKLPKGRAGGEPPARGFADQEPPRGTRAAAAGEAGGSGYLRLRIVVRDGELELGGATVVDGPLVQPATLHPGVAYEVTIDGRRVAIGEVLDVGVRRSFPDPSGTPAMSGHHITVARRDEVAVRVPLAGMSISALGRAQVTLYRWEGGEASPRGAQSIRGALGARVETIGRLKGIRIGALPAPVQTKLRRALGGRGGTR